tara:strand:- start:140 stop:907 length:768 start_codon:yes stop_codon:yes gene_type:complete
MNVVILAAGVGARMKNLTKSSPKCFLKINGVSLIERLIGQLKNLGIVDISIVTGYKAKKFKFKGINYFYNKNYSKTNMFYSLMKAKKKLKKNTLIIYSDIFLTTSILKKMAKTKKNFAVAVDINWKRYWKFRFKKIQNDLETLKINKYNQIIEIGKPTKNLSGIDARYIGILKTSKETNKEIISIWEKEKNKKRPGWGVSGNSLNKAYMTDLINHLIKTEKNRLKCNAIKFKNGWYEFDIKNDFYNFKNFRFRYA